MAASMPAAAHRRLEHRFQFIDVALALGTARFQRRGNMLVLQRFQIPKCQVFQFPFELATPRDDWRAAHTPRGSRPRACAAVPRPRLLAERMRCSCCARRTTTRRTSPITASSILRRASACAGFQSALGRPVGRQAEFPQLAKAPGKAQRSSPKRFARALALDVAGIEQRLSHCRDHHVIVRVQRAHDVGHLQSGTAHQFARRRQFDLAQGRDGGVHAAAGILRGLRLFPCIWVGLGGYCRYHTRAMPAPTTNQIARA